MSTAGAQHDVVRRLAVVHERIAGAGATPGSVTVVAVTKGHGAEAVEAAMAAGLREVGENYAGELLAKREVVAARHPAPRWHFLGRVQRNKVKSLAPYVDLWQAIDRLAAGQEIARHAAGARVLVQVNVSGEAAKHGCSFEEAPPLVAALGDLGLDVVGLMAVGPTPRRVPRSEGRSGPRADSDARRGYRRLNELADRLGLAERSMGMSADLETAVEEGSTMVRIGQALFGAREARTVDADLRR